MEALETDLEQISVEQRPRLFDPAELHLFLLRPHKQIDRFISGHLGKTGVLCFRFFHLLKSFPIVLEQHGAQIA